VLYPHYATTGRPWPPSPLEDQQLAGAIMWFVGDAAFLVAILRVIAGWMRNEEAVTRRREAMEDARAAARPSAVAPAPVPVPAPLPAPVPGPVPASPAAPTSASPSAAVASVPAPQAEGIGASR